MKIKPGQITVKPTTGKESKLYPIKIEKDGLLHHRLMVIGDKKAWYIQYDKSDKIKAFIIMDYRKQITFNALGSFYNNAWQRAEKLWDSL